MRYPLIVGFAATLVFAPSAAAQQCHDPPPLEPRKLGLRVTVGSESATYRTSRYEGEYQGIGVGVGWEHRWVRVRANLPAYRLTRNGLEEHGIGDVVLDVRVPFARTEDDTLVGGLVLATSAPTGDSSRDLGMGHFMLMSGFWATWRSERAFLQGQVAYGRALTSGGGAHHGGGPGPIVSPMNAGEVELAESGGWRVGDHLRVRGGVYGAVPVAVVGGASRAAAFVGTDLVLDRFDLALEGHLPLAGDPFLAKIVLAAGARF